MSWQCEWVDGGEANVPEEWKHKWDATFETSGNIWQCRQFFQCWDELMVGFQNQQAVIFHAWDDLGHEIIYPLYARRRMVYGFYFTIVEPLGGAIFCDYQDPISVGSELQENDSLAFWQTLNIALPKRFDKFTEFRAYRLLDFPAPQVVTTSSSNISPYIVLEDSANLKLFLARRGRNLRERVSRLLRRLKEQGDYSLLVVTPDQFQDSYDQFYDCYGRQWGREEQSHVIQFEQMRNYWMAVASAALRHNKLHFSALMVNGEAWHWHLGLVHRDTLLWYKMTYDTRFSAYSPGMLHLALLVEDSIAHGLCRIDLGYGNEEYKSKWTDFGRPLTETRFGSSGFLLNAAKQFVSLRKAFNQHFAKFRGYQ